ncbi:MAG: phosphonate transport system permease protein, partial [Granulosicoccus sp.]
NVGILGRLWTEVGENQPPQNARAVIQVGGGRLQAFYAALLPLSLNRFLLFFFYRWESCMREATVLGMLGFSSLGYYISIRKSFREYDEILFFSLLGASVIIVGDIVSDALRKRLRSA